jgi:hypothetical protein
MDESPAQDPLRIVRGSEADIPSLEPLWLPLYQRRGFRPTWIYLSRFADRLV